MFPLLLRSRCRWRGPTKYGRRNSSWSAHSPEVQEDNARWKRRGWTRDYSLSYFIPLSPEGSEKMDTDAAHTARFLCRCSWKTPRRARSAYSCFWRKDSESNGPACASFHEVLKDCGICGIREGIRPSCFTGGCLPCEQIEHQVPLGVFLIGPLRILCSWRKNSRRHVPWHSSFPRVLWLWWQRWQWPHPPNGFQSLRAALPKAYTHRPWEAKPAYVTSLKVALEHFIQYLKDDERVVNVFGGMATTLRNILKAFDRDLSTLVDARARKDTQKHWKMGWLRRLARNGLVVHAGPAVHPWNLRMSQASSQRTCATCPSISWRR